MSRYTSRVSYGSRLIIDMVQTRLQTLAGKSAMDVKHEVILNAQDRRLLEQLAILRKSVATIERRFTSRGLALPNALTEVFSLDRSYAWKQTEKTRQEKRVAPLRQRIYKLQQQVNIDLMRATTRQEQGKIIDAFAKALEGVR